MKPINNWEQVQAATERMTLPVGGYVAKIKNAEEITTKGNFSMLAVSIDISEGEYSGFYAEEYRNQIGEDKKWRGVVRLFIPTDDGSEKDERTKRSFKRFTNAVEDSNSGYHWDWNEKKLKGLEVGILVRNEEWEWQGRTGWNTKPFLFISSDEVRQEKFKTPKDKPLINHSSVNGGFSVVDDNDDDLPF